MQDKSLIALDWGTSNLRATWIDAQGAVIETRSLAGGIMAVQNGQFVQALYSVCGDWLAHSNAVCIASGMIGSRQGWQEAPYLDCPASLHSAAAALVSVNIEPHANKPRRNLYIVPGVRCRSSTGQWDVMRGEETQVWGADVPLGGLCILPGTHSKWVGLSPQSNGQIERFSTYMTGELFAVLSQHSILGRLMQPGPFSAEDFAAGVRIGLLEHAHASHILFSVRTAGLMGQVAPEGLQDYLSGMLIGIELGSAKTQLSPAQCSQAMTLIGDAALCQRYATALAIAGIKSCSAPAEVTALGLRKIFLAQEFL